jgi:RHS repeat-associated protein
VNLTSLVYNNDATTVTDARNNSHAYQFVDSLGTLLKPRTVSGAPTQVIGGKAFTYDSNGFLASRTDWNGSVTTYTHDTRGNETSRVLASGTAVARTITTAWHPTFHLPTQTTDGTRVFSFTYDANGNLLSKTITSSPSSARTPGAASSRFDSSITKTLTSRGTWLYTSKGASQGRTAAPAGTTSTWSYTYNSAGQVLTATDPNGNVTTYAYDARGDLASIANALGQVMQFASYDADGRPLTIQDPNGLVTTLTYNFRGQVTSKTEAQWVTTYTYDAVGQLAKLTRQDGSFLAFTYDPAHRLVGVTDSLNNQIQYTLDAASNRIGGQVFAASGTQIRTRSYTYDAVNRLSQAIGAVGQTTSYAYDLNSNLTQVADPLGNATSKAYDALNRLIGTTDPNGGTTGFAYDALSRLAAVTDPRRLATSYVYDGLNDVTSLSSPDTGSTAKTFDVAGNPVTSTDARGNTTTYTYDALNRVTKSAFADSTSITYQYDQGANGIGRLTAMTDAGGTATWAYDVHGHVTSKQQTTGAVTLTTNRSYSATTGQLASMTYPSGSTTFYSYDANGRVSAISYQLAGGATRFAQTNGRLGAASYRRPGAAQSLLLSQITYQPFGPPASWVEGSGASHSRTFDQDGRIIGIATGTTASSGTTSLAYDAASRITTIAAGASSNGTNVAAVVPHTIGYDALGRVTSYTSGPTTQTYTYDAAGNRTGYAAPNVALTYSYATSSNRLTGISGSSTESFTYDANGNMLTHNAPSADYTYTYNARGRRTQTLLGAIATTDTINGLGQRTVQVQGSTELFVYDEVGHLIGSYNGTGGAAQETVWLGNLPVAVLATGGPFYIAPDHLGAPHQITDAGANAVWLWDHDPFGNGTPLGSSFTYNPRFPGQFFDQNAKLNYNFFRDYDPNTGRYIESDPIGLGGGVNTYGYVKGNPLNDIDPWGMDTIGESSELPEIPDPSAPYEGYKNIRKGGQLYALGCSIDLTYYGLPVGGLVQGLGGLYVLGGVSEIGKFAYDTIKLNQYLQNQFGPFGAQNRNTPFGINNPDTPFGPANGEPITRFCPGPGCRSE